MRIAIRGDLDLEATLFSGQAFRWQRTAQGFTGWIEGHRVLLRMEGDGLHATGDVGSAQVRRFLRLDGSHDEALRSFPSDPALDAATAAYPGLRVLRQDPWEALLAFLLSQNSNEARIRGNLEDLCTRLGEPLDGGHRVPAPEALAKAGQGALRRLGLGYRASYVAQVAAAVVSEAVDPHAWPRLAYPDAWALAQELPGVGPKVADCVLLYGCGHLEAFPADVWIRRIVQERYYQGRAARPSYEWIQAFARRHFGPCAGYAQHYLFHWRRNLGRPQPRPKSGSQEARLSTKTATSTTGIT